MGLQEIWLRNEEMSKDGKGGCRGAVLMFLLDTLISEGSNSLRDVKLDGCMTSREKHLYLFHMLVLK